MRKTFGLLIVLGVVGAVCWGFSGPESPAELAGGTEADAPRVRYLVSPACDPSELAARHGLELVQWIPALELAVMDAPASGEVLARLRADPAVRHANADLKLGLASSGCCDAQEAGDLDQASARSHQRLRDQFGPLRARSRGQGQLVAVLDTGCDATHPALAGRLATGVSLIAGSPWGEDANGHGTAMASLVSGLWSNGDDCPIQEGVASGARVLPVRVAGSNGLARLSDVAAGVVAAVDRGAQVILLSLGTRLPAPALDDAVAYAAARDVLVVAAAGNRNVHQDLFPAADPRVLSVGCVEDDDRLALATALAPTTDLLAAGVEVGAALPRQGFAHVTGTSVAAARVAGAAAIARAMRPDLEAAELIRVLRAATRPSPLAGDPGLARAFPAGVLDAERLVAALSDAMPLRLDDPRVVPLQALPGQRVSCSVVVVNGSASVSGPRQLELRLGDAHLATIAVPSLQPGERKLLRAAVRVPASGARQVAFELGDSVARVALEAGPPQRDLGIARVLVRPTTRGAVGLVASVEGRGVAESGTLEARHEGRLLAAAAFGPLEAGQTAEVELPLGALAGLDLAQVELGFARREPDVTAGDDRAAVDLLAPGVGPLPVSTQYQQSNKINWIADAPTRLTPQRSYLPIMVFLPEKGDTDTNTTLEVDHTTITARDVADTSGPGLVVYEDTRGGATQAPAGLVLTDEDGDPILRGGAPDVRLFRHERLVTPGSYTILRMPRAAFGIAGAPTQDQVRFVEVVLEWKRKRRFLGVVSQSTSGTTTWVLRVNFAADPLPRLSGELAGDYFDAHCHTITEWNQEQTLNPMSPKKNWGGPIPMIKEAAHAIGLTDAVDAARGRVITTDHNAYFNAGDTLEERPQLGPSSPASAGPGVSEFDAFRNEFGITAGEEVTIAGSIRVVQVGPITLNLPNGAHMLTYRGEHMDGPWHGGSTLARALGDPAPDFTMDIVLNRLAKSNRSVNRDAAGYAAHPFGDNDWTAEHFQLAFEMDPARRVDLPMHAEQTGFVTKGVQFWNGDGKRNRLDSSLVDWDDLNPWKDAAFMRGRDDWDSKTIHRNLTVYHETLIEPLLSYELAALPGVRFPRKVFMVAGNDAHGDFNFHTDRTTTLITSQSSFQIDRRAFGNVKTYAMPHGQTGASPNERSFEAMIDGNSVLTDGPLLVFSLDGEDRFDGERLVWHDQRAGFEDRDGQIGGGGAFDGRGTLLVERGSPHVRFGYRHKGTPEFQGDVESVLIHRTSVGDVNPEGRKPASRGGKEYFEPRGTLVPGAADVDHEEPLDPAEEGTIDAISAIHLAGFTHADPRDIDPDGRRCLTNPVWCVPFDAEATIARVETKTNGKGEIPVGALTVTLTFDMSLRPEDYGFEVKALDSQGNSSDLATGPIDILAPQGGVKGWIDFNGALHSRLSLTNSVALPLDLDRYPSASEVTFVVYAYSKLQDPFGNALHRVAFTFQAPGIGSGGGTGPALARATSPTGGGGSGSTAPGATPGNPPALAGRSGGGGCVLTGSPPSGVSPWAVLVLLSALAAGRVRLELGERASR